MKSSGISIKKKTIKPKSNISASIQEKPKKYIAKNPNKKYIYKREKATDTDKVLQNNKLSKNYFFSPVHIKKSDKDIKSNINSDFRRPPEMREDVSIDYEKYQQQTSHTKTASLIDFNFLNNINTKNLTTSPNQDSNFMNQSHFLLERKNAFMENSNRSLNDLMTKKWKCPQCGNVNSNFNYLCNNCNMPNNYLPNNTLNSNQRNNSAGKNIKFLSIDNNNIVNNSFKNKISSNNIFTKSINNTIIKKQPLKKTKTKNDLTTKSNNNLINSPFYSNIGFNTIRPNKNNSNYFYNDSNNNINNSSNFFETDRDSNITHLYSYSNYLANELKTSNDANTKLMENYQNNENEYKSIYEQNDLIKKKIKVLKEKENQLNKINAQLQKSLQFIKKKFGFKNNNNNYEINTLMENEQKNFEDLNSKINKYKIENEKLNKKLKENKDVINKMKIKIGELSEEKNNYNINIKLNEKIEDIIEIKNNIEQYIKDIQKQNQSFLNS